MLADSFAYAFIGLLSTVSPPVVSGVYKVFGSQEGIYGYAPASVAADNTA